MHLGCVNAFIRVGVELVVLDGSEDHLIGAL